MSSSGSLQSDFNRSYVAEKLLQTKDSIRPSYITAKGQKQIYTPEVSQISFELYIILLETYVLIIHQRHFGDIKKKPYQLWLLIIMASTPSAEPFPR